MFQNFRRIIKRVFYEVEDEMIEERQRGNVIQLINDEAAPDRAYWSLIVLSAIIATLGLQSGNGAVIIGAMIIAPLIWPILAVSISVVRGEARHFGRTILHIFTSLLVAVTVSIIITLPFIGQEFNSEILLRSSPNIIDLFIALFSGSVAALSVSWPKISNTIAGVAVAASLMPPVSVVGIGLANGDVFLAYGALLLFLTNLFAIFIVSIVVFYIVGFRPKAFLQQNAAVERMRERVAGSIIIFLLFLVPFSYFIANVYKENNLISDSRTLLRSQIIEYDEAADIKSFKGVFSGNVLHITSEIYVPINHPLDQGVRDRFATDLSDTLGYEITLNLVPIPTLNEPVSALQPQEPSL